MDDKFEEKTGEYEEREDSRLERAGAIVLFLLSPVFSYVMFEFVTGNFAAVLPKNAVLNIVWMFALYLLVFGISGSTRIAIPASSVILYAISLAETFVVSFRSRPIMMGDVLAVKTAMTVAGSYNYTPTFMMIICGVVLIIWNVLAQFVFVRVRGKKKRVAVFGVSAGAVAAFIGCFYSFVIPGLNLDVNLWDPMTSYAENGYVLASAISIKYLVKKAPEGYSQAKIQEIYNKYVGSEKEQNEETTAAVESGDAIQPTNIICIMNESLSDLAVDGDFTTNIDYFPFLHSLTENTVKGKLCMPVFGAMTSNSEFEFLIGDSMYLMPTGSVAYQFYVNPGVRSMVSTVKEQGYTAVAMHPYPAENWNRRICYNNMGFNDFMDISGYEGRDELRNYVSDLSDFKVITEYIENKANPDDKLFLFNVTMQNHGGYTIPYANFDQEVWLTGDMEGKYPEADMYLSLVKKSDEAFEWLVNYFSQCDQPTMIVMFGDHQPGIEDEFFDEAMGVESAKVPNEQKMVWYETPFVIWTNYDQPSEDMGRLGAIYLSSYVLKRANLSLTPYNEFLLQLSEKLPIIHHLGIWESDGTYHSWEDAESGDYEWKDQLLEYENLVYNHSLDPKTVNEMFSIAQ